MQEFERFNAPDFKHLESSFKRSPYKSINTGFRNKIKELCEVFSVVEPYNEDWHSIWVVVPRGTIEDFSSFEDAKDYMDVNTYEEYENLWKEYYPHDEYWFKIGVAEVDDYLCIAINNSIVFEYNPSDNLGGYDQETDENFAYPHIDAIIYSVKNSIVTIKIERFGDQAPKSLEHQCFTVYCDSNNIYEALAGAYKSVLDEIEKTTPIPSFGARETHYIDEFL